MNKKVLLINIPSTSGARDLGAEIASMPPLGQMYIASYLKKNGYDVRILDLVVERMSNDEFIKYVESYNPLVVGVSSFYESWSAMRSLCKVVKKFFPNIYLVIGGNGATFSYEEILNTTNTDFVILGEGEITFLELCDALNKDKRAINDISGISFKVEEKVIMNPSKRILELDKLPFPDRNSIDIKKYTYPYTICTTRGCVGECKFCSSKAFYGRKIIFRTIDNIIEEIKFLKENYFLTQFYIVDDSFTINKKRAIEFCNRLNQLNYNLSWFCEARADTADEELLTALRKAGCFKIQFGMESGNNEILQKIGKNTTTEQIENAVKVASDLGMDINLSFIIGHAWDTLSTIEESFEFALKMRKLYQANVLCSINTPYPGTFNYTHRDELGIKILTENWDHYRMNSSVMDTKYIDHLTLNRLLYEFYFKLK